MRLLSLHSVESQRVALSCTYALDRSRALYAYAAHGPEYAYPAWLRRQYERKRRRRSRRKSNLRSNDDSRARNRQSPQPFDLLGNGRKPSVEVSRQREAVVVVPRTRMRWPSGRHFPFEEVVYNMHKGVGEDRPVGRTGCGRERG